MAKTLEKLSLLLCRAAFSPKLVVLFVALFNRGLHYLTDIYTSQITLNALPELLEEIVHPGALESRGQIAEDLTEMREQLRKQVARVRELRVKKVEEPGKFHP